MLQFSNGLAWLCGTKYSASMVLIRADKRGHGKEKSGRQGRGEAERSHDSLRHCKDWFSFVRAMNSDEKARQRTARQWQSKDSDSIGKALSIIATAKK